MVVLVFDDVYPGGTYTALTPLTIIFIYSTEYQATV